MLHIYLCHLSILMNKRRFDMEKEDNDDYMQMSDVKSIASSSGSDGSNTDYQPPDVISHSSPRSDEDVYMEMAPRKSDHADLCIIFADDGSRIENYMRKYLTRDVLGFKVKGWNIQSGSSDMSKAKLGIILLTPDMVTEFEKREVPYFEELMTNFEISKLLCYDEYVDGDDSQVAEKLGSFKNLEMIHIKSNKMGMRKAFLRIAELVDKEEEAAPSLITFKLYPKKALRPKDRVFIVFKGSVGHNEVYVKLKRADMNVKRIECTRLHSHMFTFRPEGALPGKHSIEVFSQGKSLGISTLTICEQTELIANLVKEIVSPAAVLYSSLGCESRQSFDQKITKVLKNADEPTARCILEGIKEEQLKTSPWCDSEFPTLLHFGARFNLESFCKEFQGLPECSRLAIETKNMNNKLPFEVALASGYTDLASDLQPSAIESTELEHPKQTTAPPLPPRSNFSTTIRRMREPSGVYNHLDEDEDRDVMRRSKRISSEQALWTPRMDVVSMANFDVPVDITKL